MKVTINREGYPYVLLALLAVAFAVYFKIQFLTYFFILTTAFFTVFFRDPQREVPSGKNILVSPADGKVMSVKKYGAFKEVHIFLGPLDVHINRSPVSGVIQKIKHKAGKHGLAFRESSKNEENYITIAAGKRKITVVQVVGMVARRLRCWVSEREKVEIGQKLGMIILGSGTRLIMPASAKILVKEKQRVKGGETIIAHF